MQQQLLQSPHLFAMMLYHCLLVCHSGSVRAGWLLFPLLLHLPVDSCHPCQCSPTKLKLPPLCCIAMFMKPASLGTRLYWYCCCQFFVTFQISPAAGLAVPIAIAISYCSLQCNSIVHATAMAPQCFFNPVLPCWSFLLDVVAAAAVIVETLLLGVAITWHHCLTHCQCYHHHLHHSCLIACPILLFIIAVDCHLSSCCHVTITITIAIAIAIGVIVCVIICVIIPCSFAACCLHQ